MFSQKIEIEQTHIESLNIDDFLVKQNCFLVMASLSDTANQARSSSELSFGLTISSLITINQHYNPI